MSPTNPAAFSIAPVRAAEDLAAAINLIQAYVDWLNLDLGFQNFAAEISNLSGKYASPTGALLLARDADGEAIGCVGVTPFSRPGHCEMKRLYVDPRGRGLGLGRRLAEAAVAEGRRLGYRGMLLDSLAKLTEARALYRTMGFVEVEKYYDNPIEDVFYFKLEL